jgi:hypothetical protein
MSDPTIRAEKVATTAMVRVVRTSGWIIQPIETHFGTCGRQGNVLRRRAPKPGGLASVGELLNLAHSDSPGPSPSFGGPHILLAFLTIASSSYVGRQTLAAESGIGEGATRTILRRLKEKGYVDVIKSGCYLTRSGKALSRSIRSSMSDIVSIPKSELTMGDYQAALVVREGAKNMRTGIEQRDSAIRIGAEGATTYVMKEGKFTIPGGSSNCERDFPSRAWSQLRKDLRPKNYDAVVLCGAGDDVSARLGALAAATTLL